ncbi:hypothetical protein EDB89DRAFT_1903335 [Lactarius sanguifluus]|nr:hypothetical protein EDB89DRAFT_1903335 [Lactarius sanguifluus]
MTTATTVGPATNNDINNGAGVGPICCDHSSSNNDMGDALGPSALDTNPTHHWQQWRRQAVSQRGPSCNDNKDDDCNSGRATTRDFKDHNNPQQFATTTEDHYNNATLVVVTTTVAALNGSIPVDYILGR